MNSIFLDRKKLFYDGRVGCHYYKYNNCHNIRVLDIKDLLKTIYYHNPEYKNYNKYLNWFNLK